MKNRGELLIAKNDILIWNDTGLDDLFKSEPVVCLTTSSDDVADPKNTEYIHVLTRHGARWVDAQEFKKHDFKH